MKLSAFIVSHMEQILAEWEDYAQTMRPAADSMTLIALRDHAEQMLRAIALDIEQAQSPQEEVEKSQGLQDDTAASAASIHGAMRHASSFTLLQLSSEFRALRATVLRGWLPLTDLSVPATLDAVVRFNEAIDQALAESIVTYSDRAGETRELFLAILGHDLRGPLATMSLAGELLSRAARDGTRDEDLGLRVKRAARFMSSMVEDMIGFTRTKLGGGMSIARQAMDVGEACAAAVTDAEAMHPECTYQLQTHGDLAGSFDGMRLHQLLVNLLGNAGQHGAPEYPVRITARGDADTVRIEVWNQGDTIPAGSLERIFEPLVQLGVDGEQPVPSASLGLGLFIAREIAKGHGGSLTVTSDASGTVFAVCLPRDAADGAAAAGPA
jgi:signal transduction histidine kinase